MIPRLLVPEKLSPVSALPADGRRRAWTILDDRQIIQADLPVKPLESDSRIPLHMPLEVLGERLLIPREAEHGILELPAPGHHLLPTDADERIAVPGDARPSELVSVTVLPMEVLEREDLVTADVFSTGQVRLMPKQVSELPGDRNWLVPASSLAFHLILVAALLSVAVLFPHHEPTQAELEAASRQLSLYLPPNSMFSQPKSAPRPAAPGDNLRLDPGLLKKLVPESIPTPAPGPVTTPQVPTQRPPRELPSAPVPQVAQENPIPRPQTAQRYEAPKPVPDAPNAPFHMPSVSPGRALEDSMRGAASHGGTSGVGFEGRIPGAGGGGGGGAGGGVMGGGLQMLTPDQGVDFNSYLNQVVARVKKEWYNEMPDSARLGDRGVVVIDFKIMRDGTVPMPEPILRATSGKVPLDRAALGSIRASSPFEPLPGAFSGPFIELRFSFFYNYRPEEIR